MVEGNCQTLLLTNNLENIDQFLGFVEYVITKAYVRSRKILIFIRQSFRRERVSIDEQAHFELVKLRRDDILQSIGIGPVEIMHDTLPISGTKLRCSQSLPSDVLT